MKWFPAARWPLVVVLIVLVVFLVIYGLLTSTAVARFVLYRVEAAVPQLAFAEIRGSFTRGLRFDLRYSDDAIGVDVDEGNLVFVPGCLRQLEICIDRLEAQSVKVALKSTDDEPPDDSTDGGQPLDLPAIRLPVDVRVQSLAIGSLLIEQDAAELYRANDFDSVLSWRDDTLQVERFTLSDSFCLWALQGRVTFSNRYPLAIHLGCKSADGYGHATADITGDLEQLAAQVQARITSDYTAEPAPVQVELRLAPLEEPRPMRLTVKTGQAIRVVLGEQILDLQPSRISARGPLLGPDLEADLVFENSFWPGRNRLSLQANATTEQLKLHFLRLTLPEGQVEASGDLVYENLGWDGQIAWEEVDLAQFSEAVSGRLNGELSTRGRYADGALTAEGALQTSGNWQDRTLTAGGGFQWQDGNLAVENFHLQQGDNRLRVAGDFAPGKRLDLVGEMEVPRLGVLFPENWAPRTSGQLRGEVSVSGPIDNLVMDAALSAADLEYGDFRLARGELQLEWFGTSDRRSQVDLTLDQLALSEDLVGAISLSGGGNVADHALQLELSGLGQQSDKNLRLACSGGFPGAGTAAPLAQWRGQCAELTFRYALDEQPHEWRLASPIHIEAQPEEPAVSLSSFCLINEPASLCSREPLRFRSGKLSDVLVTGTDLPFDWFQPLLPDEEVVLAGDWQFRLSGARLLETPELSAELWSSTLAVQWQGNETPVGLDVTELNLGWNWADRQHQLRWRLQTEASGSTRGEFVLDGSQIAGALEVDNVQLADYSRLFLPGPNQALAGEVEADLRVNGTLEEPELAGQVRLGEGMFQDELLPAPLQDIQLNLDIDDNRAVADGSFRAAESEGEIGGEFDWSQGAWSGRLTVAAEPLLVRPEPDMRVHVAPDLEFLFSPQSIDIVGTVEIPRAQVELTQLPEQAVGVSPDQVIVGEEADGGEAPVAIGIDIELALGDQVFFEGFGLETRVTGNLRLQQSPGELFQANGVLRLQEGRYTAYGQNLAIRRGDLMFVGNVDNPQLRLEAVRADTPEDVVVGLRASGPARSPEIALFSNPDMPQQAQLRYLVTGNPPGAESQTDPQVAAAEAALSYALESSVGAGIARRAGGALGIEDLQVTAEGTEEGTQIGLSGYVTPNLLVRYGMGVFDAINTLTLRYQLTKSLYLEAISGEGSDVGLMWSFERD